MSPDHDDFPAVRRQADALRDFFGRETGWALQIEHEGARLYKLPADLASTTRGLPFYDRRRYVLLCLACAVLERAEPQITLRLLGERLLQSCSIAYRRGHDAGQCAVASESCRRLSSALHTQTAFWAECQLRRL
jgi:uncharacterized protein (TIGR02678 family)